MKFHFCKKQYIYLGLALVSIGLAFTTHVSAQETTAADPALSERTQNRIINLARNMISRFSAAAERSEQITGRMESRIQKLKAQGVDTAQAEEVLGYARAELNEAKGTIGSLDSMTMEAVTSESPADSYYEVKQQFRIASFSIRDSYTHLRTIIGILSTAEAEAAAPKTEE